MLESVELGMTVGGEIEKEIGLTTTDELHKRIRGIDPTCPRCGRENEFLMHLLFYCAGSRATWFISELALRVDSLPLDFAKTLLQIAEHLTEQQIADLTNIMWCLWKARNAKIFSDKDVPPRVILMQATQMRFDPSACLNSRGQGMTEPILIPSNTCTILMDASWEATGKVGVGIQEFDEKGQLVHLECFQVTATNPAQAEAQAMLFACNWAKKRLLVHPLKRFLLLSDCKNLVEAINENNPSLVQSWQAIDTVAECCALSQSAHNAITIKHAVRQLVRVPHEMANQARRTGMQYSGPLTPDIRGIREIQMVLDTNHFIIQTS